MPIVTVPGQGDVEFPDSMKDEEIVAAIKKLSAPKPQQESISTPGAALAGALKGTTYGWDEKAKAGWRSLFPESLGGKPYQEGLAEEKGRNDAARAQHPTAFLIGELTGGAAPGVAATALTGGAASPLLSGLAALAFSAGQGALQGAGYSDAHSAREMAGDTLLGAGVGTAGHLLASLLGVAGGKVAQFARGKRVEAVARAGEQAAEEVAQGLKDKASSLGGEVQKGSRQIENVTRLEPAMTPAQQAELAAQRASGAVPDLEQRVAQSTLEAMPTQAATIAAKDAELAAAKKGASSAFQTRKDELLQPQFGKDAMSYAKSYAEPFVWSGLAAGAGHAMGLSPTETTALAAAAGMVGGRTRAGKALMTRLARPGNQAAMMDALESVANSPNTTAGQILRQLLARGGTAAATQQLVTP